VIRSQVKDFAIGRRLRTKSSREVRRLPRGCGVWIKNSQENVAFDGNSRILAEIPVLRSQFRNCVHNFGIVGTIPEVCPQFQDCRENPQIVATIFKLRAKSWNCAQQFLNWNRNFANCDSNSEIALAILQIAQH